MGLAHNERALMSVHPNPATEVIHFNRPVGNLMVYDQTGRIVKQVMGTETEKLDISELQAGTYFAITNDYEGKYHYKFIKL